MSVLHHPQAVPRVLLFDWHATLVDTMDAMYHAVDDVLPRLDELGLVERLLKPESSKTVEDAKLVKYVRKHARLHPKIRAERKISRTDIFEVLFGDDQEAKRAAHKAFDTSYAKVFGEVHPLEEGARDNLQALRDEDMQLGVLSNRSRTFMAHELFAIEGVGWVDLFDTMVCGDDVAHRKPAPDLILKALENLEIAPSLGCWYIGDSTTDVIAAAEAGVTPVFYNGAGWDQDWIDHIFPRTVRHPHFPHAVVRDLPELHGLVHEYRHLGE